LDLGNLVLDLAEFNHTPLVRRVFMFLLIWEGSVHRMQPCSSAGVCLGRRLCLRGQSNWGERRSALLQHLVDVGLALLRRNDGQRLLPHLFDSTKHQPHG